MTVVPAGTVGANRGAWPSSRRAAVEHALFALLPALVCGFVVYEMVRGNIVAIDFRDAYRAAGHRLLVGDGPYRWSQVQIQGGEVFVYPALAALMMVPFALLPAGLGALLFSGLCAAAAAATLRVLDVRDWRLYGLTLAWPWMVAGWQTGNLTLLLGLGLALLWRFRDRALVAGLLVALLVSLKPFTAPIALWLLVTRRYRSFAWGIGFGVAINLAAWGIVGFDEIRRYLDLSSTFTSVWRDTGYGALSVARHLGLGTGPSDVLEIAGVGVLGALTVIAGRRRDDLSALTGAIALMLVAGPLVWSHYFALLVVPLAIAHPRLHRAWLMPLVLWGCAVRGAAEWQIILTWTVVAIFCFEVVAPRRRSRPVPC